MKKVVILGCENSHADSFLKYIQEKEEFSDVEVIGIFSDEAAASEKLRKKFGVAIMDRYDEAVGKVDGVMITARHGDNHYQYAKPYIESGVPMFIDKPITINENEAVEFMKALEKAHVRITGGSSLRQDALIKMLKHEAETERDGKTVGGIVRAPIASDSPYGGFFFYAQHLVEMVCEIFGRYPKSVLATASGPQTTVLFRYDGFDAVGVYLENNYVYYAARFAEHGTHGATVKLGEENDWFYQEFAEYHKLLCGGKQTVSYHDFIAPVFLLNAIKRSMDRGQEEKVREYTL